MTCQHSIIRCDLCRDRFMESSENISYIYHDDKMMCKICCVLRPFMDDKNLYLKPRI